MSCLGSVFAVEDSDAGFLVVDSYSDSLQSDNEEVKLSHYEINDNHYPKSGLKLQSNPKEEDAIFSSGDSVISSNDFSSSLQVENGSSVINDGDYASASSTKTKTKIVASNVNMNYYDGTKLNAYIKTTANKAIKGLKITIKVNGNTYNRTSDANGKVVLGVTNGLTLYPGTYSCVIKFAGNSAYAASSKTINVTVSKWNTKMIANNLACYYNDSVNLVATLQNSSNKAIKGKSLNFTINGVSYYRNTDSNGKVTFALPNLVPGSYSCLIKFGGDKVNSSCSKTVNVTVKKWTTKILASDLTCYYNDSANLLITLQNNYNKALSGNSIIFIINGTSYSKSTDSNGKINLNLPKLVPGSYSCSIKFNGDYEEKSQIDNQLISILVLLSLMGMVFQHPQIKQLISLSIKFLQAFLHMD